jgi:hypothetical protein
MTSPNDILFGTGTPGVKFQSPGDTVTGPIVELAASQQTDYKTKEPLNWPDGKPRMQVEVKVKTSLRDSSIEDDDGVRRLFVKGKILTNAVKDAVRATGAKGLEIGGVLTVTYIGDAPAEKGLNAPKLYEAEYVKPNPTKAANAALGLAEPAQEEVAPFDDFAGAPGKGVGDVSKGLMQMTPAPAAPGPDLSGLDPDARKVIEQMLAQQAGQ